MKSRRITAALLLAACGAGIRSTAKNDEGIPELTLYNETTVAFAEALHDLYFDKIGAVCETMAFRSYKTVIFRLLRDRVEGQVFARRPDGSDARSYQRVRDDKLRLCLFRVYRGT